MVHLILVCLLCVACGVYGSIKDFTVDCTDREDGVAEIACDGYINCDQGKVDRVVCTNNTYYDREAHECLNPTERNTGCDDVIFCGNQNDGSYPDIEGNCVSYYVCEHQQFLGHQYCPPELRFNLDLGLCDWPENIKPPCGTAD